MIPDDMGELSYKDILNAVVRVSLHQIGQDKCGPRARVVAALAAQITSDTWIRRSLGKVPRTKQSILSIIELLSQDVRHAVTQLSESAVHSLASHLVEQSS